MRCGVSLGVGFIICMCGGVTKRLADPGVMELIDAMIDKFEAPRFMTLMCNSIAKHLPIPGFMGRLDYLHGVFGKPKVITLLAVNGIAAR